MTTVQKGRWMLTAVVMAGLAAAVVGVSGQAQPPVRGDDVLPALLVEVKGLRAAMEQMAAAGPRVQLFVGRLQLQEGRIAGMIRRLDTVRDALAAARRDVDRSKGSMQMLESGLREQGVPPEQLKEMPGILAGLKKELTSTQANVDRLAAEEQQLANDLATEQARWVDINQRLDELERALAAKR